MPFSAKICYEDQGYEPDYEIRSFFTLGGLKRGCQDIENPADYEVQLLADFYLDSFNQADIVGRMSLEEALNSSFAEIRQKFRLPA